MLVQERMKFVVVGRFHQVCHFVGDDVVEQVFGLFRQFRVQPNGSGAVVARAPFRFHSLERKPTQLDLKLLFPFFDDFRQDGMEESAMPLLKNFTSFG